MAVCKHGLACAVIDLRGRWRCLIVLTKGLVSSSCILGRPKVGWWNNTSDALSDIDVFLGLPNFYSCEAQGLNVNWEEMAVLSLPVRVFCLLWPWHA